MNKTELHPLYHELVDIVGSDHVSQDQAVLRAYAYDASVHPPGPVSGIAVVPSSSEEVSRIVCLANETNTSVVPRGGGANIHGYVAGEEGKSILIDMTRMRRVIEIDTESRFVTAEAGIVLGELSRLVEDKGFYVHTVAVPQYVDSLGGVMSGQEGGGQNIDNNPNWRYILGFKVVLPNGEIVQTGTGPGTNTRCEHTFARTLGAPDITGLFLGDCGTFGIKTEVTLQIFPNRTSYAYGAFTFDDFEAQWHAISALMDLEPYAESLYAQIFGLAPESTQLFTQQEESSWSLIYAIRAVDDEDCDIRVRKTTEACKNAGGKPGSELLADLAKTFYIDREIFDTGGLVSLGMWQWNESVCMKQDGPRYYLEWREFVLSEIKKRGMQETVIPYSFMVPFDCGRNAFQGTQVFVDSTVPEAIEFGRYMEEEYLKFCVARGMFTESTQGRDADAAAQAWSPTFRHLVKTLKQAIDPNGIMNPGVWNQL